VSAVWQVPTFLIALVLAVVVAVAWWWLGRLIWRKARPRFARWLWRRMGGDGEPPQ
jgi:ABC-type dipeptide/oligopeptide/nickel transport system permease component